MNEAMREQMLNVMFSSSKEELDEGLGTAIKHGAQNVGNAIQNAFAVTAKQKAQAANRTATLKATQAAENEGNKQIKNAKKAGKTSYKDIMSKWSIKSANEAMQKAANATDIDTLITGLEFAVCGINVLGAGSASEQSNEQQQNAQDANDKNKELGNAAVDNAKANKDAAVAATQNVSGNDQNQGGQNNV